MGTVKNAGKTKSLLLVALFYLFSMSSAYIIYLNLPGTIPLLLKTLITDIAATTFIFIASWVVNNSSVYDPYWSMIPPFLFSLWFTGSSASHLSPRKSLLLLITMLWSLRLTVNWITDWPGLHHEDWRYMNFRNKFGKWYWPVSFWGIHLFPTLIVFFASIPAYLVLTAYIKPVNGFDILAFVTGITAVWFEWKADQQMREHRQSTNLWSPMNK